MNARLPTLAFALIAALAACSTTPQYAFQPDQAQRAIDRWLYCDECSDHQLYHLKLVGKPAVPALEALKDTPSSGFLADIDSSLKQHFATLLAHDPSMRISEDAFIAVHKAALANRIRARAIIALEQISPRSASASEVYRVRRVR